MYLCIFKSENERRRKEEVLKATARGFIRTGGTNQAEQTSNYEIRQELQWRRQAPAVALATANYRMYAPDRLVRRIP